ncbi:plastid division protein PDV2-like [Chenopodium quinoa]|uniref:Plastid division protein PDV2 n=1 Tax=Chenopodium quinoa TaxID=63459 RepID=A0A803LDX2_CHEQI|nr:plastid division protein PDV2-like [Chenopodium quinoa]
MEMEEERIGMVLVRASELRSKIANCIHKSTNPLQSQLEGSQNNGDSSSSAQNGDEADEGTDALLNICYSFDALETQLGSLQSLRQQQQYEREAVIGEIEYSRKMLLKKLSEYKGEHSDVIQEAEAFASMKVEHDNELLLPPYQTHSPNSLVLDKNYLSRVPYSRKLAQNGLNGGSESKESHTQSKPNKLWGGFRFLVHSTAKTMLTLVGVISLLSLAGFEPKLQKKGTKLNVLSLFQQPNDQGRALGARCPPGKTAVMEDGEIRCIVKERVEIPFDHVADNPDVHYGCG